MFIANCSFLIDFSGKFLFFSSILVIPFISLLFSFDLHFQIVYTFAGLSES